MAVFGKHWRFGRFYFTRDREKGRILVLGHEMGFDSRSCCLGCGLCGNVFVAGGVDEKRCLAVRVDGMK